MKPISTFGRKNKNWELRSFVRKRNIGSSFQEREYRDRFGFRSTEGIDNSQSIEKWVSDSGIDKHITFHCARHTCATLLLNSGVDIYTVKEILGHTDIGTSMQYAKVVDKTKREAVNSIPVLYWSLLNLVYYLKRPGLSLQLTRIESEQGVTSSVLSKLLQHDKIVGNNNSRDSKFGDDWTCNSEP